ncbi:MAG: alpha/beta fold hydrolase [Pirellulales bacterium]|nr:alpha/beta fold hydrolase [Pirellulales bacterium]
MPADWRPLYPFSPHELRLGGHRYHYVDEGQGQPLLLAHGNPTWSFYWRNLITAFRDRYRVIAIDHIGCGLSDKPQNYPYQLSQHIENLSRLVCVLDLHDVTLVGHDWGGAIGLGAALRTPDRFARFVMFNTGAFRCRSMPLRIRICRTPILGAFALRGLNAFLRAGFHLAIRNKRWLTPEVRAGYLAPYNCWNHRVAIDRFVNDIPMKPRHLSYSALLALENGISTLADRPWLLLWGMRDWCFHSWFLDRFLEIIPRAEVHRFVDAGHWVVEDAMSESIEKLRVFLAATKAEVEQRRRGGHTLAAPS